MIVTEGDGEEDVVRGPLVRGGDQNDGAYGGSGVGCRDDDGTALASAHVPKG
jgi:hypothetical protein